MVQFSACIFFDVEALHDFYFDRTSFNIKGMQSFAKFNYSTAQGGSLFGVTIFAKFEYRILPHQVDIFQFLDVMISFKDGIMKLNYTLNLLANTSIIFFFPVIVLTKPIYFCSSPSPSPAPRALPSPVTALTITLKKKGIA